MGRYSRERREWVLRQMMPPLNRSVAELKEETGITSATLYNWRNQARKAGAVVPGDGKHSAPGRARRSSASSWKLPVSMRPSFRSIAAVRGSGKTAPKPHGDHAQGDGTQ